MANKPVLMLCPPCKKKTGRQIAVQIVSVQDRFDCVQFEVICVGDEAHESTIVIDKYEF